VLAASFEALAGALSLSEGQEATERILERLLEPQLEALAEIEGPPKSAKSRLQEWTQRHHGVKPSYRLTSTSGPPHEQHFEVAVMLDGRSVASGDGSSRQRAEERAADAALAVLLPDAAAQGAEAT
jgi:ribonuclease-3